MEPGKTCHRRTLMGIMGIMQERFVVPMRSEGVEPFSDGASCPRPALHRRYKADSPRNTDRAARAADTEMVKPMLAEPIPIFDGHNDSLMVLLGTERSFTTRSARPSEPVQTDAARP